MARTGSGKTAAFLVPMFEKLKAPQAQTGARALILTPTRELALQTMKFTKEVRLMSVCCCLVWCFKLTDIICLRKKEPLGLLFSAVPDVVFLIVLWCSSWENSQASRLP